MERKIKKLTLSVLMLALCSGMQAADQNDNMIEDARALLPIAAQMVLANVNVGDTIERLIGRFEYLTGQNLALTGHTAQLTDQNAQLAQDLAAAQPFVERNALLEYKLQGILHLAQWSASETQPVPTNLLNDVHVDVSAAEEPVVATTTTSSSQAVEPVAASSHIDSPVDNEVVSHPSPIRSNKRADRLNDAVSTRYKLQRAHSASPQRKPYKSCEVCNVSVIRLDRHNQSKAHRQNVANQDSGHALAFSETEDDEWFSDGR